MKILLINTVCGTGSTGHIVKDLYESNKALGNEVKIIYGRGSSHGVPSEDACCFNSKIDFYLHVLLSRLFDSQGLHSKKATKKIIEYIEEFKPDIVHLHNIHGYFCNYKMLFEYLASKNIKVVWTLHDCWSFTGHCAHFDYADCDKWMTECNKCPCKKEYPVSWLKDNSKNNFLQKKESFTSIKNLTVVCPSQWLKTKVENSFLNKFSVKVINNGIDLSNFKRTDNHSFDNLIDRNKKTILAVADVWTDRKGLSDLIELSKKLSDKYQVVVVGVNDKQFDKLKDTKIIPLKRTNNQKELAELYSLATAFINCTYEEVFGMVNVESQSCGTPVITYKTGGSVESITKENGIIVNQGSVDGLIEAIKKIESGNYDKKEISSKACSLYSNSIMCKNYTKLYEDVVVL